MLFHCFYKTDEFGNGFGSFHLKRDLRDLESRPLLCFKTHPPRPFLLSYRCIDNPCLVQSGVQPEEPALKLRSSAFDPWLGHGRNAASRGRTPGCSTCNWESNAKINIQINTLMILCGDPWRKQPKGKGVFFIRDKLEGIYGFAKSKKGVGIVVG